MLVIWITVSYLEITIDLYLGYFHELYYFSASPELSFGAVAIKLFMSPLFAIPFLNFMPKKSSSFIPYSIVWAIFATFYEWTTVYFGYLTYTGWRLWYSFIFYLLIFPIVRWFHLYTKH
ncbi:hypothetical protein [Natronincola peptidivorans]